MRPSLLLLAILLTACAAERKFGVTWAELNDVPMHSADTMTVYGSEPSQFGEWRLPEGKGPHPVVMLIHGGCWLDAFNLRYMGHLADALTRRGYATYNIEYRRLGNEGGGYPGTLLDIRAAFSSISKHRESFRLDLDDITVTGHSAGGHLALWLATETDSIRAVVGLAAIADIETYAQGEGSCNRAAARFIEGTEPSGYNPIRLATPKAKTHMISGSEDVLVPASFGEAYSNSKVVRHTVIQKAGHFDLVAPQSGAWNTVLNAFD